MDSLTVLEGAVAALRSVWAGENGQVGPVTEVGRSRLVALTEALGDVARLVGGLRSEVAAEIARESRTELGSGSLAREYGYRNATALIAAISGVSGGEAARLVLVGEAIAPRTTLTGESMPAKFPFVAAAVMDGRLGTDAAAAIVRMLERVSIRAEHDALARAEELLVAQAPGLTLEQLGKLIVRAEAFLDPDGIEPREIEGRDATSFRVYQRNGRIRMDGDFDPETGAPIVTAIQAMCPPRSAPAPRCSAMIHGLFRSVRPMHSLCSPVTSSAVNTRAPRSVGPP